MRLIHSGPPTSPDFPADLAWKYEEHVLPVRSLLEILSDLHYEDGKGHYNGIAIPRGVKDRYEFLLKIAEQLMEAGDALCAQIREFDEWDRAEKSRKNLERMIRDADAGA